MATMLQFPARQAHVPAAPKINKAPWPCRCADCQTLRLELRKAGVDDSLEGIRYYLTRGDDDAPPPAA